MERDLKSTWKLKPKVKAKRKGDIIMIGMVYEALGGHRGVLIEISVYEGHPIGILKLRDSSFISDKLSNLKLLV